MRCAFVPLRLRDRDFRIYRRYFGFLSQLGYSLVGGDLSAGLALLEEGALLLLPGGGDVGALDEASRYNDAVDLFLARRSLSRNGKVLGICRGLQVVDVALGGTLKKVDGHEGKKHWVNGDFNAEVNSYHHEAISTLGAGVEPFLKSADGVVEGIKVDGRALAFQFHPELMIGCGRRQVINYISAFFAT